MAPTILQNVYRNGHTYLLVDNGPLFTWTDAEAYAVTLGGHLATIDDGAENNFVYDTFAEVGNSLVGPPDFRAIFFYLGYSDAASEGTFVWSSGSSATFESWHTAPSGSDLATQDYAAYFFYHNYVSGFDPTRKWFRIPNADSNNYTLALIELPNLLATAGADTIEGGIGDDKLTGLGGNDTLRGFAGNDELKGGDDDDTLDGGLDADTLEGGDGNDTYEVYGNTVDTIVEAAGKGTDTVKSQYANFTLPANVENVIQVAPGGATGNGERNKMQGSTGNDFFDGAGGNDTLYGNDGDDSLRGGTGKDKLYGGDGNDEVTAGPGNGDILEGGADFDSLNFSTGDDTGIYKTVEDIGKGKVNGVIERITRFDKGDDLIDLSAIDANGSAAKNGKFKFIGSKAFSDTRGELRATEHNKSGLIGDYILIEGDVNGDGKADFRIRLDNFNEAPLNGGLPYKLSADDFAL